VIVADTNIIAYLFVSGPYSALSVRALQKDPIWVAPRLWRSEFRNVLALQLRKRLITLEAGLAMAEEAFLLLQGFEHEVESERVLELAESSGCTAYDCEFVALALDLGVRLVTQDRALLRQFPDIAVSLDDFVAR
jgi:predicted nucleic acid-binding protein